ncbi:MAG: hypothetical protein KGI10_00195 [Thaumarchaeota archaeon]|nr:hypothetical protein [Nitrososphaerota archaeon]
MKKHIVGRPSLPPLRGRGKPLDPFGIISDIGQIKNCYTLFRNNVTYSISRYPIETYMDHSLGVYGSKLV